VRRFSCSGLPYLVLLFLLPLVLIQGCARPLLQTYPASEQEIESAAAAFASYQETNGETCGCCLDAEADAVLLVSGWLRDHTGRLSGYLQAMQPGYVKFVAVNPLGQPMLIFVTDGRVFKSLNVFESKAYTGSVFSETYRKFAPRGFEPQFSYYWLTGRLMPGDKRIQAVMRDREQGKFWLQIRYADPAPESMVLFDPEESLILRHVLRDEQGERLMDVRYADYRPVRPDKGPGSGVPQLADAVAGSGSCRVPGSITVFTNGNDGKIEVKLSSFLEDARFTAEDFTVEIPENFEYLPVR
jgi:hypothetical protein